MRQKGPRCRNEKYWGKGIGRRVIVRLLDWAWEIGFKKISLNTIYHYNQRSQNLFKSVGFVKVGEDEKGCKFEITL